MKPQKLTIDQARHAAGLRIVTLAMVPSPWGEALRGILHVKELPHARVAHAFGSSLDPLREWSAQESFPIMAWNDERPLSTWIEQLYLAERLAPTPQLIPARLADRVLMFGYSNELCGENGLGWTERLRSVHVALTTPGGDRAGVSKYLGKKYGYTPEIGARAAARVVEIVTAFADRLDYQRTRGSRFFVGDTLSALDIYWAAFTNMMRPLEAALCPMPQMMRDLFTITDPAVVAAARPILFEHRDFIFKNYLELPVDLS
jgi:glutathione S-transferase